MKKLKSKAVTAAVIGAAGIVALSACSSGSDQAEADRNAAQASSSASPESPPTKPVPMPKLVSNKFKDVTVTHSGTAKCKINETSDKLQVNCDDVGVNWAGDQVFIRVPSQQYVIHVEQTDVFKQYLMMTTRRDAAYLSIDDHSYKQDVTWRHPYKFIVPSTPWGVGIEGPQHPINFEATVTKERAR